MRAVPGDALPYRDFYYPLNVFMHMLTHEEGGVTALHYGLFERPDERITDAQDRSTRLLLTRLPPPPARVLDVGSGLGTTAARLTDLGYVVTGITPDAQQVAMIRARYGDAFTIACVRYEDFPAAEFDVVLFQESSQYIDSAAVFGRARELTSHVIVLDEFSMRSVDLPGALHLRSEFLDAAEANGFRLVEEIDLSEQAAPTIDYFTQRLPRYRDALIADLGLTSRQVDDLIENGGRYRELYRNGTYGYLLLQFRR